MSEHDEILGRMTTEKLLDIVKNYRQYGYADELRSTAIRILGERGITQDLLDRTGNLQNASFDDASDLFRAFNRYSLLAFICYAIFIVAYTLAGIVGGVGVIASVLAALEYVGYGLFLACLIKSFLIQRDFYKLTSREKGEGSTILFLVAGLPFYFITYFFTRKEMREQMSRIR